MRHSHHRPSIAAGRITPGSATASARSGFTLFEIAISLAIVGFIVAVAMALVPVGLRMQQHARFQLLASTKAMELIEFFGGKSAGERIADFEAPEPWEARPFCYASTRWDLEQRLSRWDSGIMPVPPVIARRLDSDGDEIARLLDEGAALYYADPRAVPGIDVRFLNQDAPNEAQKLVFAVAGYAQHNAIPVFPHKAWPYLSAYPSPPMSIEFDGGQFAPLVEARAPLRRDWQCIEGWSDGAADPPSPGARDPLMSAVFATFSDYFQTLRGLDPPLATREATIAPSRTALLKAVRGFCVDKFVGGKIGNPLGGLPLSGLGAVAEYETYLCPPATVDFVDLGRRYDEDFAALCRRAEQTPGEPYNAAKTRTRAEIALRVQCLRFLAFAMGTWWQSREGEPPTDLSTATFDGYAITVDRLRYLNDRCKAFAMRYAATFPYDWGAPRPVTRTIMTDYPLLEYDLFAPPRIGTIVGTSPAVPAAMWKPIAAQAVTSIGLPGTYPGMLVGGGFDNTRSPFTPADDRAGGHPLWGDASRFTLCRPFQPTERCRELVFWSVHWQAYEDAETAPSAPLDASRCPLAGLRADNIGSYDGRLGLAIGIEDGFFLRNPERELCFGGDVSSRPTGAGVRDAMLAGGGYDDQGLNARTALLGIHGADRNHDFTLDRGPLPPSVRQRAVLVARFPFYDPRLPITLR